MLNITNVYYLVILVSYVFLKTKLIYSTLFREKVKVTKWMLWMLHLHFVQLHKKGYNYTKKIFFAGAGGCGTETEEYRGRDR